MPIPLLERSLWDKEKASRLKKHHIVLVCHKIEKHSRLLSKYEVRKSAMSSAEIFKCCVAVISGSGKICNQLPPASAEAQQTKAARGLGVSDPNMASCCLLYTETDGRIQGCTVYT